ncbi:molybdenum cofactor guanylyltransferase [Telmatocola sphagniphila]|uniref:Probable molybdenum cofactor guanylyltransferase n=1 Tax=Telmatocola sphagniphila TaxID=1123043 RepID=A0A8E6B8S1_9BACT|nr:molybdenum cofactor guanylyltransferase [Telmatocola sphagniphila]QVL33369.1 molybdenum cofactor guanylyltransferase [Telmatocola sphagniphila]
MNKLAAAILCGGQSRRMGSSKAWLSFGDETCLQRAIRIASSSIVQKIYVVAAPEQDLPTLSPNVTILRDERAFEGPLRGLFTSLRTLSHDFDRLFLCGCDTPFLKPQLIDFLADKSKEQAVIVPRIEGRLQPLHGRYDKSVLPILEESLKLGQLRMTDFLAQVELDIVEENEIRRFDPLLRGFMNLNSREEYETALKLMGEEK